MSALRYPRHEQFAQLIAAGKTPAEAYALVGSAGWSIRVVSTPYSSVKPNQPAGPAALELQRIQVSGGLRVMVRSDSLASGAYSPDIVLAQIGKPNRAVRRANRISAGPEPLSDE